MGVWEYDWLEMVKVRLGIPLGGVRVVNDCFMTGRNILEDSILVDVGDCGGILRNLRKMGMI